MPGWTTLAVLQPQVPRYGPDLQAWLPLMVWFSPRQLLLLLEHSLSLAWPGLACSQFNIILGVTVSACSLSLTSSFMYCMRVSALSAHIPAHQKRAPDATANGCVPLCGCWDLNSGLLEEGPVFFTSEPSLQHECEVLRTGEEPAWTGSLPWFWGGRTVLRR